MNTNELNAYNIGFHYRGCFPADCLPTVDRSPFGIITNTDPSNLPGTHWVAIFLKNRIGEYFDSAGSYPPPRIEKYLNRNCLYWKFNRKLIQQPNTMSCGRYCLYFLKRRLHVRCMEDALKIFSSDLAKNEKIIKDLFIP